METNEEDRVFMKVGDMPHGTIFHFSATEKESEIFHMSTYSFYESEGGNSFCSVYYSGDDRKGLLISADYKIFEEMYFKTETGYKTLEEMTPGEIFLDNRNERCVRVEAKKADDPVAYRLKDYAILYRLSDTLLDLECEIFPPGKYDLNFSVTPKKKEASDNKEEVTPQQEELTEVKNTEVTDEVTDQTIVSEEKPVEEKLNED
jgi:hypothetical protein